MFKDFALSIKIEYILKASTVIVLAMVVLFMFSCNSGKQVTTEKYNTTDTTYTDTTVYNIINRDSTIVTTDSIYKDTIIYKNKVQFLIRKIYKGLDLYMEPIEDSVGLAYGKD